MPENEGNIIQDLIPKTGQYDSPYKRKIIELGMMAYTCDPEAGRAGPQRQPGIQKEKALLKDKFLHRFTEQRHRTSP